MDRGTCFQASIIEFHKHSWADVCQQTATRRNAPPPRERRGHAGPPAQPRRPSYSSGGRRGEQRRTLRIELPGERHGELVLARGRWLHSREASVAPCYSSLRPSLPSAAILILQVLHRPGLSHSVPPPLLIAPPPPSSSPNATFPQLSTTARIGGVAQDGREGAMADHCGESEAGQQGRWRHGSASSSLLLDSLCNHLRCLKPRPTMSRLPLTCPVPHGHRHGRPSRRGPLHLDEACVH